MKNLCLWMLLGLSVSNFANAGGDSSGGGGPGGTLAISNYTPGKFDVDVYSNQKGLISAVVKYILLAGATEQVGTVMTSYSFPGTGHGYGVTFMNATDPGNSDYYHLGMELPYVNLLEMGAGTGNQMSAASIRFRGDLADDLYAGMEKSGLTPSGFNLDGHNQIVGKMFSDAGIFCEKPTTGIDCSFMLVLPSVN